MPDPAVMASAAAAAGAGNHAQQPPPVVPGGSVASDHAGTGVQGPSIHQALRCESSAVVTPLTLHRSLNVHSAYHLPRDAGRNGMHISDRHSGCCMPALHAWSGRHHVRPLIPVCWPRCHSHLTRPACWLLHLCAMCLMTRMASVNVRPMLLVMLAGSLCRCWSTSCSLACCSNGS